jgi:hypothetical protein
LFCFAPFCNGFLARDSTPEVEFATQSGGKCENNGFAFLFAFNLGFMFEK